MLTVTILKIQGENMDKIQLFRRRYIPDEIKELKDDIVLSVTDDMILTKWNVLKPRKDIARGVSAYFIDKGIKVSKVYDSEDNLVYWYCDIVETVHEKDSQKYVFNDLLIDILVYPDGFVKVVDMDEFADIMDEKRLDNAVIAQALRSADALLKVIYSGQFDIYTKIIEDAE